MKISKTLLYTCIMFSIAFFVLISDSPDITAGEAPCGYVEINVAYNGEPVEGTCVILRRLYPEPHVAKVVFTDWLGDAFFDMHNWPDPCQDPPCCGENNSGQYVYTVYQWNHYSVLFDYEGGVEEFFVDFDQAPNLACRKR